MSISLHDWLAPETRRRSLLVTIAFCGFALFWQLGVRGLNEPDEGRYASVSYEMLRSGDWIVPHFQGHLHVSKPPLLYWLVALSLKTFGVNEWAARLVPALSAFGTLLLVWSLALRWWGPARAFHAAAILLSIPLFFIIAHLTDPNMLLTFWVTLGWWAWLTWQDGGRPIHRHLFYAAHAGAFLTKGPVGCVLILMAVACLRFLGGARVPRRRTWSWIAFLAALLAGLSWYLYMIAGRPELVDYFLRYELYDRLFTNVHKRGEPFWFFWLVLPAGLLPWLPALAPLFKRGRSALRAAFPEAPLLAWVALVLIFFSFSHSKLATYIVPAYPALALLTMAQLQHRDVCGEKRHCATMLGILLLAFLLPPALLIVGEVKFHWAHVLHHVNALAALSAVGLAWLMLRERTRAWIPLAAALMFVAYAWVLDVAARHEMDLEGNSTARTQMDIVKQARAAQPGPVYFTHAPAGMEYYLQDTAVPQHLSITTTNPPMVPALYVKQLADHGAALRGSGAFVIANTHYLREALGPGAAPDPFDVVHQAGKYTILRVAR